MFVLLLVIAGTAVAMGLLVLFSDYLFRDNRTRTARGPARPAVVSAPPVDPVWRTLVDPADAANRARASRPFVAAYARAMTATTDGSRAA